MGHFRGVIKMVKDRTEYFRDVVGLRP